MSLQNSIWNFVCIFVLLLNAAEPVAANNAKTNMKSLRENALRLMNDYEISYVFGGSRVSDGSACAECSACLTKVSPSPSQRVLACPVCEHCGLDCSHFLQLVFAQSGMRFPYINTESMLTWSKKRLKNDTALFEVPTSSMTAGDLLVYKGHVVLLLSAPTADGFGEIIHSTGGREIRLPGQGIQLVHRARLSDFRGPLMRVLRHRDLLRNESVTRKLRRIE